MHGIIHHLVTEYGVGYFKFDYNIEVTHGTDVNCASSRSGQLGHKRAYLSWVQELHDQHPNLLIENCSSGAQRMDYAMLAAHALQSTNGQQDPVRYAAIAAALPTAVTPEQGATWAYPQPDWDDETNAMTVVNSLLRRIHLSGRLDLLSAYQFNIITHGMDVYRSIRADLNTGIAFWPLGLPKWHDAWLALGIAAQTPDSRDSGRYLIALWSRGGEDSIELPMVALRGQTVATKLLYPATFAAESSWHASSGSFMVSPPFRIAARLFDLRREGS